MDRRNFLKQFGSCAAAGVASGILPAAAAAGRVNDPGDNKQIHFYNPRTSERLVATYWRRNWFDQGALREINYFMRDWRENAVTDFDPFLIDTVHSITAEIGYSKEVVVLSGYRTEKTNRRIRRAATDSMHLYGRAVDFTLPSQSLRKVRDAVKKVHKGGLGYYPKQHFVHVDSGSPRYWVR